MSNSQKLKSDIDIGMLMSQVDRLCTKKFGQNAQNAGINISQDQWLVLGPVWKVGGIAQKDIADYCGKDKTSVTKIIDTLEKRNLMVRVPDQIDQRIKRVFLSNKGKEMMKSAMPIITQTRNEVSKGITDKEIDLFKTVLIKIYKNLTANKNSN
ncbi:MarR family transcriptional regulator [Candidatus Marinimicrobia bacterium]|nr:MarR family transcriptional regulator [Candidatus Neomarinimicrobiota bacterium]